MLKNKQRKIKNYRKQLKEKKNEKRKLKSKRKRQEEEGGKVLIPRKKQKTIENTKVANVTKVSLSDSEVLEDAAVDEWADYFEGKTTPSVIMTTSASPSSRVISLIFSLLPVIPGSIYRPRRKFTIKSIVRFACKRRYTDLLVFNEDNKKPNALLLCHLPNGPTAHFKLTSLRLPKEIKGHGRINSSLKPEVVLNNFTTRLGLSIGRMFASLFPQQPDFVGRQVVTFHNQRDFIFFRCHRYLISKNDGEDIKDLTKSNIRLQELGPRFCLKLRSLQSSTFNSTTGEYEWLPQRASDTNRRRFAL